MSRGNILAELEEGVFDDIAHGRPLLGGFLGIGPTKPADNATGWEKGALFIHSDLTGETDALYSNIGDVTAANFNAVTVAAD